MDVSVMSTRMFVAGLAINVDAVERSGPQVGSRRLGSPK
jgi:hypothetical protein